MGTRIEKNGDFEIQRDTGPCALGHDTALHVYWDEEHVGEFPDNPNGLEQARKWVAYLSSLSPADAALSEWWKRKPEIA